MTYLKLTTAAMLALTVSACGSIESVTRNVPFGLSNFGTEAQVITRDYTVRNVIFAVSEDLSVSEGNSFYPVADIVWRGDPVGNRVNQISALFGDAMERNKQTLLGNVPVNVEFELLRFHGVTERTRFSVGGNYNIIFNMTVRHAETGVAIESTRRIASNLSAPGGSAAILAEQRGQTEKVRVTDFLTQVLADELNGKVTL